MQPTKNLLKDQDVKRWHDNLARGSKLTASVRLRRLNLFCQRTGKTPTELVSVESADIVKLENILLDHVSWLESQNYAPGYVDGILKAIRSWLAFNYVETKRRIKIKNADIPVTIQDEKVPTKEELAAILDVSGPRARASISLMAFSGLRPQVLGNYDATDGLKLSDIEGLEIKNSQVMITKLPVMITVRPSLSKARNKYFTFLPREGCNYLLGYLKKRLSYGEHLDTNSPVITFEKGYDFRGNKNPETKFITTKSLTSEIRSSIKAVMKARPYVLRAYFDTQLLLSESNGKISHAYRQFFMAHKGDMEARYTVNKGRLTTEMIEDMRRTFLQSEQFLCTNIKTGMEQDKKQILLEMWKEQAKIYGIDPMKIRIEKQRTSENDALSTNELDAIRDAIQKLIREKEEKERFDSKLVDEDELLPYVKKGWDVLKELSGERVLIRRLV
jgi:hypothetical protein